MTLAARKVLEDCEAAYQELARETGQAAGLSERDLDPQTFRRRWTATVVLLRTVGHVLDKIDRHQNPEMAAAIDEAWSDLNRTKPSPEIFWEFIEAERNTVLKVYQFSLEEDEETIRGAPYKRYSFVFQNLDLAQNVLVVLEEAIRWWHTYLEAIDEKAALKAQS